LQGLLGPLVFALPAGVIALCRPKARWLAIWGFTLTVLYSQNVGARLAIPAFVFLGMSVFALLPRGASLALASVVALLCTPIVAIRYADASSLPQGLPWAVVTGAETKDAYLVRTMPKYTFAKFIHARVSPGSLIFDCSGVSAYYSGAVTMGYWQTEDMMRVYRSLLRASGEESWKLRTVRYSYSPQTIRAIRIQGSRGGVVEVRPDVAGFSPTASPWPVDARLAVDSNYLTEWDADLGLESRAHLDLVYPEPVLTSSLKIVLSPKQSEPQIEFLDGEGKYRELTSAAVELQELRTDLRSEVGKQIRMLGFNYLTVPIADGSQIRWSRDLMQHPEQWGFRLIGGTNSDLLYSVVADSMNANMLPE
jgi:hypothetical protein